MKNKNGGFLFNVLTISNLNPARKAFFTKQQKTHYANNVPNSKKQGFPPLLTPYPNLKRIDRQKHREKIDKTQTAEIRHFLKTQTVSPP